MNPVAVSATAASLSALVALSALGLSLFNYFRAKDEPARARQREIRDQLRSIIEPARDEMKAAVLAAQAGRSIPDPSAEFVVAHRVVTSQAPRRADVLDQARSRGIGVGLMIAANYWTMALNRQSAVDAATAFLNDKVEMGPEATMDTKDRARAAQRARDIEFEAAKAGFLAQAATTVSEIDEEIGRLDAFDRGVGEPVTGRASRRRR